MTKRIRKKRNYKGLNIKLVQLYNISLYQKNVPKRKPFKVEGLKQKKSYSLKRYTHPYTKRFKNCYEHPVGLVHQEEQNIPGTTPFFYMIHCPDIALIWATTPMSFGLPFLKIMLLLMNQIHQQITCQKRYLIGFNFFP